MDRAHSPSRRAFLRQSDGLAAVSGLIGIGAARAETAPSRTFEASTSAPTDRHYYLTDVRLEEGFEFQDDMIRGTQAALHTIGVRDGRADFVLVPAASSAEAVARRTPRSATFHKGRLVFGGLGEA